MADAVKAPTRWIADNGADPRYSFWTRANVSEVLPEPPSPLGWDLVFEGAANAGWRDTFVNRLGMGDDELDPFRVEAIGIFGGYAYLGASLFRVWAGRTPGMKPTTIDEVYFGDHPDVPSYVAEPWHENAATTEVMTHWLAWATVDLDQSELEADRVESLRVRAERPDYSALSDRELFAYAVGLRPLFRRMFDQHINQSLGASVGPSVLNTLCSAIGRPELTMRLLAGLGGVDSAAPAYALWDLSREARRSAAVAAMFEQGTAGLAQRLRTSAQAEIRAFSDAFEAFIAEFGSRGPNEWDLVTETWELDPDAALAAVDRMRAAGDEASPVLENAAREKERTALAEEVRSALAGNEEALGGFAVGMASAATFIPGRERSKTSIIRVVHEARLATRELGRRLHQRGIVEDPADVYLLFMDELDAVIDSPPDKLKPELAERRAYRAWLASLQPPFIIAGRAKPNTEWAKRGSEPVVQLGVNESITGVPGCPGVARGRARIVLDPADPAGLEPGDVLIAPITDPSWTPLFVPAAGVVVEVGAMLSHAVIVSRELGIPCVGSAVAVTRRIPDGALVEVDGDRGVVTVISMPA